MTVTSVHKDTDALTMTITADYASPVDRVWQLWTDPRLLEKWWGPPTYPATFKNHDLSPGGSVTYFMTGPEGDQPHGWWRVTSVDAPHRLEFEDGFADDNGNPNPELPTMTIVVTLSPTKTGTRMAIETTFESVEAMEQILAMGAEEGMKQAMGQIDALLAA
ncbi:MAG: SRPBCC domain-containing protein [Acidimicrobiia bacterium]